MELTREEKAALVSGTNFMETNPIPAWDIPGLVMADGPHGLRKQTAGGDNGVSQSEPATASPQRRPQRPPGIRKTCAGWVRPSRKSAGITACMCCWSPAICSAGQLTQQPAAGGIIVPLYPAVVSAFNLVAVHPAVSLTQGVVQGDLTAVFKHSAANAGGNMVRFSGALRGFLNSL